MNENRNLILAVVAERACAPRLEPAVRQVPARQSALRRSSTARFSRPRRRSRPPLPLRQLARETALLSSAIRRACASRHRAFAARSTSKGARIDDLWLLKHRISIDQESPPVPLLSPQGSRASSFVGFGWNGPNAPNRDTVWTANSPVLAPGKPVTLSWTSPAGQSLPAHRLGRRSSTSSRSSSASAIRPASRSKCNRTAISRAGRSADASTPDGPRGPDQRLRRQGRLRSRLADDPRSGPIGLNYDPSKGWIGFTDKYWLTALVPRRAATQRAFR